MIQYKIMTSIEQDNLFHLNRYKFLPPDPSYIAGFIDGDGCLFIRKISCGYQSGISITQCRTNILQILRYHFGGNLVSSSKRNDKNANLLEDNNKYHKHNIRNQYDLVIRSNNYKLLLCYLQETFVVKEQQYQCLIEFDKFTNLQNKNDEKELLFEKCRTFKKTEHLFVSRINIQYISGLFDAEGCFFINKKKINKFYISISQKNHPILLEKIKSFLGFGKVVENKFIIYDKPNSLKFIQLIKENLIVKFNQAVAFETYLVTNDKIEKEKMYQICNEEKHKIEIFNNLNNNNEGKEAYYEKLKVMKMNEDVFKEIIKNQKTEDTSVVKKSKSHEVSDETRKKMSLSIRNSKQGVSDDVIIQVREMFSQGHKNIDIQKKLNLPRHTVTRIKSGILVCRDEEKVKRTFLTQEQINMSKRKIQSDEIIIVIEKIIKKWTPTQILDYLIEIRNKNKIENTLTIDIIKNIKRKLMEFKDVLYESEVSKNEYEYYKNLLSLFAKNIK